MLRRRSLAATLPRLLLPCLVMLGCGEPLFPVAVDGWYTLKSVGVAPFWSDPGDETERALSGDLVLLADGSARTIIRVEDRTDPSAPQVVEYRRTWDYERDGATVTLRLPQCIVTPGGGWGCGVQGPPIEFHITGDLLVASGGSVYRRIGTATPLSPM